MAEKETGKCKKARYRVEAIGRQIKEVKTHLENAHQILSILAKHNSKPTNKEPDSGLERIRFNENEIDFYIDFCFVSEDDNIEGAIVYGALRVPRHPKSEWEYKDFKENRPLFSLSIDEHGKISTKGKLDDEWWLKGKAEEREKAVKEMHYRVLDLVWRDALNWRNEAFLP